MDLVYPPVIGAAHLAFRALGLHIDVRGSEHIPPTGGAVLAINHVSYPDFVFAGFAARPAKRLVRFMAKEAVFRHPVSGPLMRGMHHIPVDREAGTASFRAALDALRAGEIIGVFPEATISRSWTIKELKSGATRMATSAKVPLIPVAVWGAQRIFTKGRDRDWTRGRTIAVEVGAPLSWPQGTSHDTMTADLRVRMQELLEGVQKRVPEQPKPGEDAWWHPRHLGGTAPTPEEAAAMDARDKAEREARRAAPPA